MKRGLLIAIDGIDGSGKSTVAKELARALRSKGMRVVLTKEPTRSKAGLFARKLAEVSTDDHIQAVFADDRARHVKKVILPALNSKSIVICDRYVLSSLCCSHDQKFARKVNSSFSAPDISVVLDVPVSVALKRLRKKGISSMFEAEKELERVRKNYLKCKSVLKLDGTSSIEELVWKITKEIKKFNPGL